MNIGYEVDFLAAGEEQSGDAIALRFGNLYGARHEQVILAIDGGFADTGDALVRHIQTYYGTSHIDLVVSTHPDGDHAGGLEAVLTKCTVGCLWMHQPWNHTEDIAKMFKDGRVTDNSVTEELRKSLDEARSLERMAQSRRIPIIEPFAGVSDASQSVWVLGPSQPFYESLLPNFRSTPEPVQKASVFSSLLRGVGEVVKSVAEDWDIETLDDTGETSAENNSSTILIVRVGDKYLLFTGDAGIPALTQALDRLDSIHFDYSKLAFIQVPHHGSRRNVGPTILNRLLGARLEQEMHLRSATVSVAKPDDAKHPSKKVTNAFRRRGAPVVATAGSTKGHYYNAPGWPARPGWSAVEPLPLYGQVEE